MVRKLISVAVSVLLLACMAGCSADWAKGLIKEYQDNKEGIHQEIHELWDGFLEEIHGWTEASSS